MLGNYYEILLHFQQNKFTFIGLKDFEFGIHEFMRNSSEPKVNPGTLFQS